MRQRRIVHVVDGEKISWAYLNPGYRDLGSVLNGPDLTLLKDGRGNTPSNMDAVTVVGSAALILEYKPEKWTPEGPQLGVLQFFAKLPGITVWIVWHPAGSPDLVTGLTVVRADGSLGKRLPCDLRQLQNWFRQWSLERGGNGTQTKNQTEDRDADRSI